MRRAGLGFVLLLAAGAPGCFLPELIVLPGTSSSGGAGPQASGGVGPVTDGVGGQASGGVTSAGDGGSGGSSAGGTASGGNGVGGGSGGAAAITGYFESGGWHGFVSTFAAPGQIDPPDFDDIASAPYCMTGTVEPQASAAGQAGFSWFLN